LLLYHNQLIGHAFFWDQPDAVHLRAVVIQNDHQSEWPEIPKPEMEDEIWRNLLPLLRVK
jgi:hypothetical protein